MLLLEFQLEGLGQSGQLSQGDFKPARDPPHVPPGRVDATRLDVGNPGRVDLRPQAELLLAEVDLSPKLPDCPAEANLWIFATRHLWEGMRLPPPRP